MMNPVVHFEMPYRDGERAAHFYTAAFGWQAQMLGPQMGDYVLVTTAVSDVKPGAPAGAGTPPAPKAPQGPPQGPALYLHSGAVHHHLARPARVQLRLGRGMGGGAGAAGSRPVAGALYALARTRACVHLSETIHTRAHTHKQTHTHTHTHTHTAPHLEAHGVLLPQRLQRLRHLLGLALERQAQLLLVGGHAAPRRARIACVLCVGSGCVLAL